MKQLLILCCIAIAMCSCGAVKKITYKTHSNTDSTRTETSVHSDFKKKDSAATTNASVEEKKSSDSTYKKTTTVVREYFADDLDFSTDETHSKAEDYVPSYEDTAKKIVPPGIQNRDTGGRKIEDRIIVEPKPKLKYRETITTVEEGVKSTKETISSSQNQTTKVSGVEQSKDKEIKSSKATINTKQNSVDKKRSFLLPWWVWALLVLCIAIYVWWKWL